MSQNILGMFRREISKSCKRCYDPNVYAHCAPTTSLVFFDYPPDIYIVHMLYNIPIMLCDECIFQLYVKIG